jgi:hypothetical protein
VIKRFSLTHTIALVLAVLFAPGNAVLAQVLLTGPPAPSAQIQPPYVHCTAASPSVCYVVPTIVQCAAYTKIIGCTDVLPTLATCVANASVAGCSAVLPSPATCLAAPKTAGCTVAPPSFANNAGMAAQVIMAGEAVNRAQPTPPPPQVPGAQQAPSPPH